jgi:hypothetical protein
MSSRFAYTAQAMRFAFHAALVAALLLGVAGCTSTQEKAADARLASGMIMPTLEPQLADQWYRQWAGEPDVILHTAISDALINLYVPNGQVRLIDSPPGYVVQLVLVDAVGQPLRLPGSIDAVLVARPHDATAEALLAWTIDSKQAELRYRRVLVPGYLLPLGWDQSRPTQSGEFMLVVRWTSEDKLARVTRNIVFEDDPSHGTQQTPPN